jgi:hypothetical protein
VFKLFVARISKRLICYVAGIVILSLILFSSPSRNGAHTLWGVSATDWYGFVILLFFVDFCTTTADHVVFYALDNFWCGHFNLAYLLHSFKGPLGLFMLIIIVTNGMADMAVPKALTNFDTLITACVVVLIFYSIKNYFQVS